MQEKQKCRCGCGALVEAKKCVQCGVTFYPYHSSKGLYCSAKCQGESRKGANNPAWKGGKVERICQYCGKIFITWPGEVEKNKALYCSVSCRASDINKQKVKDGTHNLIGNDYSKGKPKSEETKTKLSISKKGRYVGTKNSFYGKKHSNETIDKMKISKKYLFESGYRHLTQNLIHKGIDGHLFRSIKEIDICNWLTNNNIEHEIEPPIPFSCKLADFKVKDWYIEVWNNKYCLKSKERLAKIEHYKKYNIKLIEIIHPDLTPLKMLLENL